MKIDQIQSFFWSVFSRIWTEYGKIGIPYLEKNSVFGHFSRSAFNPLKLGFAYLYHLKISDELDFLMFAGGIEKQHRAVIG